jgi:hypothetical protein
MIFKSLVQSIKLCGTKPWTPSKQIIGQRDKILPKDRKNQEMGKLETFKIKDILNAQHNIIEVTEERWLR